MRPLSDTLRRLAAFRHTAHTGTAPAGKLVELTDFGSNPGALRAWTHLPGDLSAGAPLVVVLHGCTQNAAGYDRSAGWSSLAEAEGFALLFPEQQRSNNPNLCFNWFQPEDTRRGGGEALSIRQMIDRMVMAHGLDRRRIFVTGLSAGGAMASTMLATYPEVFAGGAIIAGLAHGVATTVPEAFDRMRAHGLPEPAQLQDLVRGASDHAGPWPTLSIWQGSTDRTVSAANADAILDQWRGLHGVRATQVETVDGHRRTVWRDREGRAVIERYDITGMAHGTPVDGAEPGETAGAYMLDVGISSTRHIARFWDLAPPASARAETRPASQPTPEGEAGTASGIRHSIESALRQAGLMR